MSKKITSRLRRSVKTRAKIKRLGKVRLSVHRTPQHIYAQIISATGDTVIASASTVEGPVKALVEGHSGNCVAAGIVGKAIAEKAKEKGITDVAFDRSGFRYHGRIKALADAARENGLNI